MNVIVIGLGSMGKRRVRLIQKIDSTIRVIGVDGKEERCKEAADLYNIDTYGSIAAAKQAADIQCAFICTSPLSHANIIHECLENSWNVFTELNLVTDRYEENMQLAEKNNCTLFLSSTFFYRDEITYIRKKVKESDKMNYIYHVGQYLPDWHPWENYKDFFVGNQRTNGCRELMAIELPWLCETFGKIKEFRVISDKITDLAINYNDNYMIQLTHENGNKGTLIVDVVSPKAVRKLEVYAENLYFSWDGTPSSLMEFNPETKKTEAVDLHMNVERVEGYSSFVIENAYQNEIQEFFAVVEGKCQQQYSLEKDMEILTIIDKIEGI